MLIAEYVPWKYAQFQGYTPGSFPHKAQYFDVLQQLYPWKALVIDELKSGRIPFWNPYNFSGSPLLANSQSSVFTPINILYFFLPFVTAWTVSVILQCVFASIFTYLFARKLALSVLPSLFAAVTYSYSLYMTVFLEYNTLGYVVALLPAALFLTELLLEKRTFFRSCIFSLSLSLFFLVGHLQIGFLAFCFVFAYTLGRVQAIQHSKKKQALFSIMPLFVFAVFMAAIQLLPTFELISFSARVPQDYTFLVEKLLIQPWQLIMAFVPDFFGNPVTRNFIPNQTYPTKALSVGIATLLFAFICIWQRKKIQKSHFFLIAAFVIFFFVTRQPLSELFYLLRLPFFSTSSPSNTLFLLSFCLSILAGFGLEHWAKERQSTKTIFVFWAIFLVLLAITLPQWQFISEKNIFLSVSILILVSVIFIAGHFFQKQKQLLTALFFLITLGELFFFFQKFNPFVTKEAVYPPNKVGGTLHILSSNGERVWSFGSAFLEPNIQTALRIFSPDGYDPLYPKLYGEFLSSAKDGKITTTFDNSSRSNAMLPSHFGSGSFEDNPFRMRVLDLLSVRYILDRVENGSSEKTFSPKRFRLLESREGWRIYENLTSVPRAVLVGKLSIASTAQAFEKQFYSSSFDPKTQVILHEPVSLAKPLIKADVATFLNLPGRTLYKTRADGDGILLLSDSYYPGWKVFIDGKEAKVLRANYAFLAVQVPVGEHDVVFYYWPQSFVFGLYITIIGIVGLIGFSYMKRERT